MTILFLDENLESHIIGGFIPHTISEFDHAIRKLQDRYRHYDEIKWTNISRYNKEFLFALMDYCRMHDAFDFFVYHNGTINEALYEESIALAKKQGAIDGVIIDYFSTSSGCGFEKMIGSHHPDLMLIQRQNSKANTMLQMVDFFLGLMSRDETVITSQYKKDILCYAKNIGLIELLHQKSARINQSKESNNGNQKKIGGTPATQWVCSDCSDSIPKSPKKSSPNQTILITGSKGMLGSTFYHTQVLEQAGYAVIYVDRDTLDISDLSQCQFFFETNTIHTIINCAAYTNVEKAEDEGKIDNYQCNVLGPTNLALCAKHHHSRLIHISTDYVFDGSRVDGNNENDSCGPLNHYGLAKWLGEEIILRLCPEQGTIVRTSWLYGGGKSSKNFVNTMLTLGQTKSELRVIADQRGAPTRTNDLVNAIVQLIQSATYSQAIYHFSNHTPEGGITRYDFAKKIFALTANPIPVHPIPTSDYPTKAVRPRHSHLINNSSIRLPDREPSLQHYLASLHMSY